MKCVKGLGFLWVAVLAAFFALSACDDSSSASPDETGTSSSSVETSDLDESSSSVDKKSSGNESTEKNKSSSSVKGSEPAEVSSSSAKETKDSSDSKSSSSVKTSDSSSSNKDKSSSSVNSSSSNKQSSSSVKSSSSSVKQSSSSVASSSSEYVPFDHSQTLGSIGQEGVYKTFTDSRNGRSYYYMEFKGVNRQGDSATVTAMAENLNIGEMVAGDKDQADDSKVERYCYDNDTINCDRYGGLYQWAEMMKLPSECNTKSCADSIKPNHQGICPDDWRLLTYDDFVVILNSNGNNDGIKGVRSTFGFGGYNTTGYSLVGAGYRKNDGSFKDIDDGTYWMYPLEHETNVTRVRSSYTSIHQTAFAGLGVNDKSYGVSVRCVKSK
ncbi:major paralogous domain-containing protein [Fibrobacter sp. UWCM]|uniref:FISUMP domain-containing protein n=1 Tax=Fibrobacter sp. UWCM TaxID=1896208 RepID=UPI00091535FC|nr:FISUMP domain-containing protein [Fibrobacter sp. UWCM]SHH88431.1 major paralogous domain-containing protein [Fibrobacter sp. UWCM]